MPQKVNYSNEYIWKYPLNRYLIIKANENDCYGNLCTPYKNHFVEIYENKFYSNIFTPK